MLFIIPFSGKAEETEINKLPPSPETGSTEEDFSAGGTRENHELVTICDKNNRAIAYLLGNNNREFTSSAYPVFWFYIPSILNNVAKLQFVLTEVETDKKVYERILQVPEATGLVGLPIPNKSRYSLVRKKNYSWSLSVKCTKAERDFLTILSGWIQRKKLNSDLQNRLAIASDKDKYNIYLKHNLLYDALDGLAQSNIANYNNHELTTAWNQLLIKLGWEKLSENSLDRIYLLNDKE